MAPPTTFADRFVLDSPTGAALCVRRWRAMAPRAVLLIQHGLAEHGARYDRAARELAAQGIETYAHDHRGHGSTTAQDAPLRRFASRDGASKVLRDTHAVRERAEAEHPDTPIFVLGHSLGGTIALIYAERYGAGLGGVLVWNAAIRFGWQERLGTAALRVEKMLKGSDVASQLFARSTFDAWARSVPDRRTQADWLSHDPDVVDAYIRDPLCGWTPTVSMVEDILALLRRAGEPEAIASLPSDLPLHLLGGTQDPATEGGKAVADLGRILSEGGSRHVETRIVEGARHETLNEIEPHRADAMQALIAFIDRHG
ncbi:alpha/beta hydrolase [Aureimonas sp. ME7]|uniref:alpha/beta fold hydrolase n=1 Tax=Aureimonas sp. ME7 TaxID=2744252 RepID=UPI0015F41099|nr:alpha/beta hydrolase [Aureimonas sp. ME7]